jgi:hypothetical protein
MFEISSFKIFFFNNYYSFKLVAKKKARRLKQLREEFEILQEADSFTELDSNSAQEVRL